MKRIVSIVMIFSYTIFITTPNIIYTQESKIKIIRIKGDKFAIDKGSIHGVKNNTYYIITHDSKSIGRAKVIAVREKISALEIISINKSDNINIGDELILDYSLDAESEDLLTKLESNTFSKDKILSSKNYFYEGQETAKNEYSGGGAMVGGLVAGTLLNLIGWIIGYTIMSSSDIEVPPHHLSDLNSQQKFQFSSGFKEKAKKKRNGNFHAGAAIGTLIAVIIVMNMSNSN